MKEFALKHPFLTFLLVDSAIGGLVSIVKCFTGKAGKEEEEEKKEEADAE